jgi:hypothetical protein
MASQVEGIKWVPGAWCRNASGVVEGVVAVQRT